MERILLIEDDQALGRGTAPCSALPCFAPLIITHSGPSGNRRLVRIVPPVPPYPSVVPFEQETEYNFKNYI